MRWPMLLATALLIVPGAATAEAGDGVVMQAPPLSNDELAAITGKFILSNGAELAMSVTSDTVVNGQLILRTVLTVDHSAQVQVFGRSDQAGSQPYVGAAGSTGTTLKPTGVTVALDRQSGIQSVTPTFSVSQGSGGGTVSVGSSGQDAASLGLVPLAVTPGGPAVATAAGTVSLDTVRNGSQVTLAGDQLSVANLVGSSIATALVNSANNRTIDTVTNVSIDLRNVQPYQVASAAMRVETLALDATRGMMR